MKNLIKVVFIYLVCVFLVLWGLFSSIGSGILIIFPIKETTIPLLHHIYFLFGIIEASMGIFIIRNIHPNGDVED